jgi:asparagine synthase (glutamine-hydrolysing)
MSHRGPDDAGEYVGRSAMLGFRRLAILDLSCSGHQPMTSPDGRVTLVFNGEIYNYLELRRELEADWPFRSQTDTEVLLNGYRAWGWERLLSRIDGMYAFAIWDEALRTLFAARDRAGKKPFFYAEAKGAFRFASSLNALVGLMDSRPSVDLRAVDAYLTYQAVPAPLTIYRGVQALPPAHQLSYNLQTGACAIGRYWKVTFTPKVKAREADVLEQLDHLLLQAVRKRLMSDVPLGAFLSGGVDSSLVVSMMARTMRSPVQAVVMGFEEPEFDERPFARMTAQRWGVDLHEYVLRPDALEDLPEIVWQYGQPMADVSIVPTYYVAKAIRKHVTVALNGDGGDELFGGYARPLLARCATTYRRLLPGPVRRGLHSALSRRTGPRWRRAQMLAKTGALCGVAAFRYGRAFGDYRECAYADSLQREVGPSHADNLYSGVWADVEANDEVDRVLHLDFSTYLPDQLLTKMDVSSMAHSVEARSPFLDRELTEFAATIPTAMRLRHYRTKYLLKRLAERYVPREVIYRRKRGFVMPASQWLRQDLLPCVRAVLESQSFRDRGWLCPSWIRQALDEHVTRQRDWTEQLWTAFILEIWARMALDGSLNRHDLLGQTELVHHG